MALDAELVLKRNCEWTEEREFRLKQRNLELIVFFTDTSVKDIRKFLLCKKMIIRWRKRIRAEEGSGN
jgi:hypothetical protein